MPFAAAETLWAGPVDIGQRILLAPAFQVTHTAKQRLDRIQLWWIFYFNEPPPSSVDSLGYPPWRLTFNYYTGEYQFTNDLLHWPQ